MPHCSPRGEEEGDIGVETPGQAGDGGGVDQVDSNHLDRRLTALDVRTGAGGRRARTNRGHHLPPIGNQPGHQVGTHKPAGPGDQGFHTA